jgi:hypothetical protein
MSRSSSPASASRSHSSNKSSPLRASLSTPRAAPASDGDGEDSFLGRWEGDDSAELDADADRSAQSTSRDVTSDSLSRQQFVFKPRPSSSTERMVGECGRRSPRRLTRRLLTTPQSRKHVSERLLA